MDVEITNMPALRLGALHHTGPYSQIGQAFGRLGGIVGPTTLVREPGAVMVAVFHDDPRVVAADQLRSEAGLVVPEPATLPAGLHEIRLPAGRYARAVHVGGYEGLPAAWSQLRDQWLPASGQRVRPGASYEIYRNDPMSTPKDQWITEIYAPIA